MRFLLIDDNPSTAATTRRSLALLGIEADHCASSEEALKRHRKEPYRIVLASDETSGVELCQRMREGSGSGVYFILVSSKESRTKVLAAPVDDFLIRPFDHDDLWSRIQIARRIVASEDLAEIQRQEQEQNAYHTAELTESLRIASRRFEDLFCGLPVACFTFDTTGAIHEWNRAAEEAFGIAAFDTIMRPVWETLAESDGAWTPQRCSRVFGGGGLHEFEWTYTGQSDVREFLGRIIVLRGQSGRVIGAVCANVDVTAHKRAERLLSTEKENLETANARLRDLASKDGLTGLFNRRAFLIDLEEALSVYATTGKPFSLVLLDIDNFKSYNDTYGHPAGDEVLRRFARVLRSVARSTENPARYGGEEFAIILHGAAANRALTAAERFRRAVEEGEWIERGVTCSLGVASVGINGTSAEALVAAADTALYVSKQQGRNRCSHAVAGPEKLAA